MSSVVNACPPVSVLGVLTIDGWDQRQKEFRNLYQTQTIGDISWMSFRRNQQAGHRMTISRENVWRTCMRIEKWKVKELDFYLNEHGLTTIGRKLDKTKAIRCHYYRHVKESVNTDESCGAKDESDGTGCQRKGIKNMRKNSTVRRTRDNDFVFNDLYETIQFKICEVVVQDSWDVSINIDVTCLHIVTLSLAFCGGWDRRGGIKTTLYALRGDHVSAPLSQ